MENDVVSIKLARGMKVLGFPQKTAFAWGTDQAGELALRWMDGAGIARLHWFEEYAAPNTQEIVDQLPQIVITTGSDGYAAWPRHQNPDTEAVHAKGATIVETLGLLWLKLNS